MQKIPTIFKRTDGRPYLATDEIENECMWVFEGEGRATVKIDGTCCAVIGGEFYARHRHKEDKGDPPAGWAHWTNNPAVTSGHGWLPVSADNPSHRYHIEACINEPRRPPPDGTYELIGPKVQRNMYGRAVHTLEHHGDQDAVDVPLTFDGIRRWLESNEVEGVVWHHPDGRMAKIKRRDFGIQWPVKRPGIPL